MLAGNLNVYMKDIIYIRFSTLHGFKIPPVGLAMTEIKEGYHEKEARLGNSQENRPGK